MVNQKESIGFLKELLERTENHIRILNGQVEEKAREREMLISIITGLQKTDEAGD
jgi:hypothetical protein